MSILQLPTPLPSQVGLLPATKKMVTTDSLATITTAGYLNAVNLESYPISASDIIEVLYNFNQQTQHGTLAIFQPLISNGVITLAAVEAPGGVTVVGTPTVNHVAKWASASSIEDGGVLGTAAAKAASDNTKTHVASVNGTTTSGHVASFADTAGTVQDGGVLGQAASKAVSDNTKATVSSYAGGIVPIGNVASFSDVNGTVQNGGVAVSALQLKANIHAGQRSFAGGASTFSIGDAAFTTSSIPIVNFISYTTPQTILFVTPGTSEFTVTFSGDPGASVLAFTCFVAAQ